MLDAASPHHLNRLCGVIAACAVLSLTADASAQPSAWAYVGGGALAWQGGDVPDIIMSPTLVIDAGIGTEPIGPVIVGGVFRLQPVIGEGSDMALSLRLATSGFQSGWIGGAIDVGGYARLWGPRSAGVYGQAILGGPFGLQLAVQGMYGGNATYGIGGSLGIDFVRLTISREHLLDWWPNPHPYQRKETTAAVASAIPWWL